MTINNYSDWYLPSICEFNGPFDSLCPGQTQFVVNNLEILLGDVSAGSPSTSCNQADLTIECIAGKYWSSTQSTFPAPEIAAFQELLDVNGSSASNAPKAQPFGVRCSRELTP